MAHPVGKPVGDARRHHAAVTVTNEDHVPPILVFEHCSHVLDMGLEIDHRMREMGALAEACVGGGLRAAAGGRSNGLIFFHAQPPPQVPWQIT